MKNFSLGTIATSRKKLFISFVITALLLLGLFSTVYLTKQKQEIRKKAAGERVDLSFEPSTPISVGLNTEFTVNIRMAPDLTSGVQVTAASVSASFPAYITLVSITPGAFFSYTPTTMEMLALGVTCTSPTMVATDCRTTALGITCSGTPGFCKNSTYPTNTATQLRFDLGAACDVTHLGCINNACAVVKGAGADTEGCSISVTTCTGGATNVAAKCYPSTTSGILATLRFKSGSTSGSGGNIAFNSATQVSGLDSGRNAISTNIGVTGSPISVTVTGGATPTPTPTPPPTSPTPTPTPTPTSTPTATPTPSPTPTATPALTPTPTPTLPPGQASLGFKIKFEGFISSSNPARITSIKAILKDLAGTTKYTFADTTAIAINGNVSGVYEGTINNVAPDTYDIYLKENRHLQRKFAGVNLVSGTNSQDWSTDNNLMLLAGDTNNDDRVDMSDFDILATDYRNSTTQATSPADFNFDARVDMSDFDLLATNYRKTGE